MQRPSLPYLRLAIVVVLVAILVTIGAVATKRLHASLPGFQASALTPQAVVARGIVPALSWPRQGQAAVALPSIAPGAVAASQHESPVPIASLAKLMTAHLVLTRFPLAAGSSGPIITISNTDVEQYNVDVAQDQSSVQVITGERLSEYQLLQALLTRSANNIAQLLATWVAGSQANFVDAMNRTAMQLNLDGAHFGDASGFNPATRATAQAVATIAAIDMRNPVFDKIVDEHMVTLPVAGTLPNIVARIGTTNVVGIKSGYTIWSGGCAAIATEDPTKSGDVTDGVAVVLDQQGPGSLHRAASLAERLADQVGTSVTSITAVNQNQVVGSLSIPWSRQDHVKIVTAQPLTLSMWPGQKVTYALHIDTRHLVPGDRAHTVVGYLLVQSPLHRDKIKVVTTEPIPIPSTYWRLVHD